MLSRSPVVAAVVKILISSSNVHQSNAEIEKNLISTYSKVTIRMFFSTSSHQNYLEISIFPFLKRFVCWRSVRTSRIMQAHLQNFACGALVIAEICICQNYYFQFSGTFKCGNRENSYFHIKLK